MPKMVKYIENIAITNFKSIKGLELSECNRINLLVGPPNVGKSNILEALSIYNFKNQLKDYVRATRLNELFFNGEYQNKIKIEIDKQYIDMSIRDNNLILTYKEQESRLIQQHKINKEFNLVELSKNDDLTLSILKYDFRRNFNNIIDAYSSLKSPFGENLFSVINSNEKLKEEIKSKLIKTNEKLVLNKNSNEYEILKFVGDDIFSLSFSLLADTLLRLVFYNAAIYTNSNSILLFEEPEAHCYEPYILDFTNAIKFDENSNQYFIVTHSDFIVQEFIRESEFREQTNIYLINNEGYGTTAKLLDKEKNKDVYEFGLNVFFNFGELWK